MDRRLSRADLGAFPAHGREKTLGVAQCPELPAWFWTFARHCLETDAS